jgi:hypothetical protein
VSPRLTAELMEFSGTSIVFVVAELVWLLFLLPLLPLLLALGELYQSKECRLSDDGLVLTVTSTLIAQIDHSDQICERAGQETPQWCACSLNLVEGCPRIPCTTNIHGQKALLTCWRLTVES